MAVSIPRDRLLFISCCCFSQFDGSRRTHRPQKLHDIESSHKPALSLASLFNSKEHDGTGYVGDGEADHAKTGLVGLLHEPAVRIGINHYIKGSEGKGGSIPIEKEADDAYDTKGGC